MGVPDDHARAPTRRERELNAQKRPREIDRRGANPLRAPKRSLIEELQDSLDEKHDKLVKLRAEGNADPDEIRILEQAIACDEQDLRRARLDRGSGK